MTQLANFKVQLGAFRDDNGFYPSTKDGLQALVQRPAGATNWHGPYAARIPKDPWAQDYIYACPGKHVASGYPYDLCSPGAPGRSAAIAVRDVIAGRVEEQWTALRIFGEEDYAGGGGARSYLGVHAESGEIFGLDVERETSQMFLLNSDADRFVRTFLALDQVLRVGGLPDAQIGERLKEIDPGAFERSEWRPLSDCVTR